MSSTKTQLRSTCTICGQDVAVDAIGNASKHGYTVERGFFEGQCSGAERAHYGDVRAPAIIKTVIYRMARRVELESEALSVSEFKTKNERLIAERRLELSEMFLSEVKLKLVNWVEFEPETIEVYRERQTAEKLAKKAAEKLAKDIVKAEKAAYIEIKTRSAAAKRAILEEKQKNDPTLYQGAFHSIIIDGVLIEEFKFDFDKDRELYTEFRRRVTPVIKKLTANGSRDKYQSNYGYQSDIFESRTMPKKSNGKNQGRRLHIIKGLGVDLNQ